MIDLYTADKLEMMPEGKGWFAPVSKSRVQEFCEKNAIPFDNRLKILMLVSADSGGVGWYRIYQPGKILNEVYGDKVVVITCDRFCPELVLGWPDIIVVSRIASLEAFTALRMARERGKFLVYEVDDWLHGIEPWNPSYPLWNLAKPSPWFSRWIMEICHGLQVSVPPLLDKYGYFTTKKAVLENCIDPRLFPAVRTRNDEVCRIGWAGSMAHIKDLNLIARALERLKKRYFNRIEFVTMGWSGQYVTDSRKEYDVLNRVPREFHDGVPLKTGNYYLTLSALDLDIAVAPITDSEFNRYKSNLKTLEYGMLGCPVVASNFGPYRWLTHYQNALLANSSHDWYMFLKFLIDDDNLRTSLGAELRRAVLEQYDIRKRIHEYYDFYQSL
jgi:glycosyltransferase involved in cell wall biosynthesis